MRVLLRQVQRLPGWSYLPGRVKSLTLAAGNPALYPTAVQIEPTRRCNLRCVICFAEWMGREPLPDMSLDFFKKVITQIPSMQYLTLNGLGEPLLNVEIVDMIRFARGRGISTRFITNLTRLNDEMAERLVEAGHGEVIVSIDTVDPQAFADIRRGADLETVLGHMHRLTEAKKRRRSSVPRLIVHAVLMKCTLPHIPQLVDTCRALGVANLTFVDLNTGGLNLNAPLDDGSRLGDQALIRTMSEDGIWNTVRGIKALAGDGLDITVPGDYGGIKGGAAPSTGVLTCEDLWEMPFITCDGYVTPCCWAAHPSMFNMGNLHEKPFDEIWFGPAYKRMRLQHVINKHPAYCRSCQQLVCTLATPSRWRGPVEVPHPHTRAFLFR